MTFLEKAAQHIYEQHGPRQDDIWVILPTRRAVSVFQQHLAEQTDLPFLAPHTLAVDDFITQAAGVQLIDPVSLVFELYTVFQEIDEKLEFEQFIGWASVLLADFDRMDQYLVKPSALFSYLTAAQALERWNLELPAGAKPLTETPGTQRYFKLFENLQTAYYALRRRLTEQGLAYRGMAYRKLAEGVDTLVRDNLLYEKVYFVGFNALSQSEERIMKVLTEAKKAEVLWDADDYYLRDIGQEAGYFLRKYRNEGWSGPWNWTGNDLTGTPKHIRVVGVPNASMQAKVAGQVYADWTRGGMGGGDGMGGMDGSSKKQSLPFPATPALRTAIVLADETLLVPVLYSLDTSVKNLNVTMGLSLRNSLLFTLIDAWFELQRTVAEFRTRDGRDIRVPRFHHRHIVKLLNHPFIRQYERIHQLMSPDVENELPKPLLSWVNEAIIKRQWVYLNEKEMLELGQGDPLFKALFTRWPADKPQVAIRAMYELIDLLRDVYRDSQDAIEIEYLYLFYTLLQQLETTLDRQAGREGATPVTVRSFRQFLNELIRQTSIPFTSEGNSNLQVMGMLETRALDFERVIVLSVNEGVFPQPRRLNSLIPFDISKDLNLPTYREQEAVMAYHFYRLLQRAKEVVLLYTTSTDAYGNSKGEPSRFVRQLEYELVPAAQGRITLTKPAVRFGKTGQSLKVADLMVPKTDTIRAQLKKMLSDDDKGLFPTALNQYISCSMRFYFSRLVEISEEEDVEERMGAAEFGSWLHETLETLDQEYRMKDRPVTEAVILEVLDQQFSKVMKGRLAESGMNLLLYQTARRLMLDFQRKQSELHGLKVLATEEMYHTYLDVPVDGETLRVKLAGKIDRIEEYPDKIQIIDYKTGSVKLPSENGKAITDLKDRLLVETDSNWEKMRQLWLYKYLLLKNEGRRKEVSGKPVEAGFYSFRRIKDGLITNTVQFGRDETPEQYIAESEEMLRKLITDMLDGTKAFEKTQNLKTCEYCDYKTICGR
ncbi:PD-(D/E)XK nuclease family protein [Nibrella viscosa]|uniref:PD-(D/E)XK nuclease family protein n=1 Tax=Nibrella viscosa TaxID=1084524 RepID=A0ABP8KUK4_9BACT